MSDSKAGKALQLLKKRYDHVCPPPEGIDELTEVHGALARFCDWGFTHHDEVHSDLKILHALLDAGADVHYDHDRALYTMVGHSYSRRPPHPISELLEHGADMFAVGIDPYNSKPQLSALELAAKREREDPTNVVGILAQFARSWRDWLVQTSSDDKQFPKGSHALDKHPALAKKLAAAVGTEDYKYVTEVVTLSMKLLSALDFPLTPENICGLMTPKDNQTFKQMAEDIRCYDSTKCQSALDMFRDVETSLMIPAAVLLSEEIPGETPPRRKKEWYNATKTLHNNFDQERFKPLREQLHRLTMKAFMKGKNIEDVLGLSEAWHSPRYEMPGELRPKLGKGKWYPLTEELALPSGHKVVCRISGKELQEESKELDHCVGRTTHYASECLSGRTHILSVVNPEGKQVSTIEIHLVGKEDQGGEKIRIPGDERYLRVIQHRGRRNNAPPQEAEEALAEWKRRVENGTLKLNLRQLGETTMSKAYGPRNYSELENKVGFPITPEHVERLFQHYRGTPEKNGLRGFIYNPESKEFEDNRRNYLITGQYHAVDGQGKKTGESIKREDLTFRQWLEASGVKEELSAVLKEHAKELGATYYRDYGK